MTGDRRRETDGRRRTMDDRQKTEDGGPETGFIRYSLLIDVGANLYQLRRLKHDHARLV